MEDAFVTYQRHRETRQSEQHDQLGDSSRPLRPDAVLASEATRAADDRVGVVLVARLPPAVCDVVAHAQARLRAAFGDAYWLPSAPLLHLTVAEWLAAAPGQEQAVQDIERLLRDRPDIARNLLKPLDTELCCPMLAHDVACVAITFLPDAVQPAFDDVRRQRRALVRATAADAGLPEPRSRYDVSSAHITIARLRSLDGLPPDRAAFRDELARIAYDLGVEHRHLIWRLDAPLELMTSATWYGAGRRLALDA